MGIRSSGSFRVKTLFEKMKRVKKIGVERWVFYIIHSLSKVYGGC